MAKREVRLENFTFSEVNFRAWLQRTRNRDGRRTPNFTSENTKPRRRGRAPVELTEPYAAVLDEYVGALDGPLRSPRRPAARTPPRSASTSPGWPSPTSTATRSQARTGATGRYATTARHLQAVLKRKPATVNNALAAVDDLYVRRGLGPANAKRAEIPDAAPRGARGEGPDPLPARRPGMLLAARSGVRAGPVLRRHADLRDGRARPRRRAAIRPQRSCCGSSARAQRVREMPIHHKLREALGTGTTNARTGPEPTTARRCFSTSAAGA